MIRFLVTLMLVLLLAVSGTLLLLKDPGYALLSFGDTTIETSLAMLALLIGLGFIALVVIYKLFRLTLDFPDRMYVHGYRKRQKRARESFMRGLRELLQGHWKKAEKLLLKHVDSSEMPMLNYLFAARAAQYLRQHKQRDEYLQRAHQVDKNGALATMLTQAELQLLQGQQEQALASLNHLLQLDNDNPFGLEMLLKVYRQLEEWDGLKTILPELWKQDIIDDDAAQSLQVAVTVGTAHKLAAKQDAEPLLLEWRHLPRELQQNEVVVAEFVQQLMRLKAEDDAEKILHEAIRQHWNARLIYLYGQLHFKHPEKTLSSAEKWTRDHSQDAILNLTLGRICMQAKLWGKARIYLEKSIQLGERAETHMELGALLEHLGDLDAAREHFRAGLALVTDDLPGRLPDFGEDTEVPVLEDTVKT